MVDARVLGTSVVVVTLSIDNAGLATLDVRADSQPFLLFLLGEELEVLVEELLDLGTALGRILTSVGLSVFRWDTNVVGTFGVINTTWFVFTVSIVSDTGIFSTCVLIIAVLISLTLWFI